MHNVYIILYYHHHWLNSPWWALAFLWSFAHSSLLRATFFQFLTPSILISWWTPSSHRNFGLPTLIILYYIILYYIILYYIILYYIILYYITLRILLAECFESDLFHQQGWPCQFNKMNDNRRLLSSRYCTKPTELRLSVNNGQTGWLAEGMGVFK